MYVICRSKVRRIVGRTRVKMTHLIVQRQQVIPHEQSVAAISYCARTEREAFVERRPRSDSDVPYQAQVLHVLGQGQSRHSQGEIG